jgi:hypothetical protein
MVWWRPVTTAVAVVVVAGLVCQVVGGQPEEVTVTPPVTPPSPRPSGAEILLSLCPPKGSPTLRLPRPRHNLLIVSTLDGQVKMPPPSTSLPS